MYTRREFGKLTVAALTLPAFGGRIDSTVAGVRLGVQTYSYRDLPRAPGKDAIETVIKAMVEDGLGECELFAPQVEPQSPTGRGRGQRGAFSSAEALQAREDLRTWR